MTVTYVDTDTPKPFLHPVTTPSGRTLTRSQPEDHPWHRGLWFTIKFVNGDNFWEEIEPYGTVTSREPGALDATLDWTHPDGRTAIVEQRSIAVTDVDDATRIDFRFALEAAEDVVLDRTAYNGTWGGYGGLAFRGAGDWTDTELTLAGAEPTARVTGDAAPWCRLASTAAGVLLLDHPENPRHPTPWYGSTRHANYGADAWSNFVNAAFLFHEPMNLAAGASLELRHRVLVHDGCFDVDRCQAEWDEFASG